MSPLQAESSGPGLAFRDGLELLAKGAHAQALQQFRLVFRQAKRAGDELSVAWSLYHIGLVLGEQRDYQSKVDVLDEARSLFIQLENRFGQALVWRELSNANRELGRNALALEYGHKSIQVLEELGAKTDLAWSYDNMAMVYFNLYQRPESLAFAKKARELFQQFDIQDGLAWNATNMGHLHMEMGFYGKSEEYFIEAQEIFSQIKHEHGLAWAYLGHGMVQRAQSQFDLALKSFERAVQQFQSLGLKDRMAWVLLNQAAILRVIGNEDEAVSINKKALQIFGPQRNHDGVGWTFFQMAQVFRDRGQFAKAWQTARQALGLHTDIESKKGIGWNENELGKIYCELGDLVRAKESFVKAKVIGEQLDESRLKIDADKNLAKLHIDEGLLRKAILLLDQTEQVSQKVQAREIEAEVMLQKTRYFIVTGELDKAQETLSMSSSAIESYGLNRLQPTVNLYRGEVLLLNHDVEGALKVWKQTVLEANKVHQKPQRTEALMGIAQIVAKQHLWSQWDRLIDQLDKDIKSLNSKRLRTKLVLIKAMACADLDSMVERSVVFQVLQSLSLSGMAVLKLQALNFLIHMTDRLKQYKDKAIYQKEREELMSKGLTDLSLVSARYDWLDVLPVSIVI